MKTPTSIQVIGIITIVTAIFQGIVTFGAKEPFMADEKTMMTFTVSKWILIALSVASVYLGYELLSGKNWARRVLTACYALNIFNQIANATDFTTTVLTVSITCTLAFFLHTKTADEFFKGKTAATQIPEI